MCSQYQKRRDLSLDLHIIHSYMTHSFLLKIKIDFFPKVIYDTPFYWRESCLFSKLNDCINWKIFYCTRSTRRKEISLSTTYYSFLYGSLRFIKGRGRTACMHPMWRVACCRTCLDFFGSDLIEAREQHFTGLSLRMFFRQINMSQCLSRHWRAIRVQQQIWNRTRPRARVQNQQTGELIINSSTLMEFMYLVFTRMPGESYRGRLRFLLLYLC